MPNADEFEELIAVLESLPQLIRETRRAWDLPIRAAAAELGMSQFQPHGMGARYQVAVPGGHSQDPEMVGHA
jgi:hypothetical protein